MNTLSGAPIGQSMNPRNWADRLGGALQAIGGMASAFGDMSERNRVMKELQDLQNEIASRSEVTPQDPLLSKVSLGGSAFDQQIKDMGPSASDQLDFANNAGPDFEAMRKKWALDTPESPSNTAEYDGNKPMSALNVDQAKLDLYPTAFQESQKPSGMNPPTVMNRGAFEPPTGNVDTSTPMNPTNQPTLGGAWDNPQQGMGGAKVKSPIILEAGELGDIGVPAQKIQEMLHDQMKMAMILMKAPPSMQHNIEPMLQVMKSQMEWVKEQYNVEPKIMNLIYKDMQNKYNQSQINQRQEKELATRESEGALNRGSREKISAGYNRIRLEELNRKDEKELDDTGKQLQGELRLAQDREKTARNIMSQYPGDKDKQDAADAAVNDINNIKSDLELIRLKKMEKYKKPGTTLKPTEKKKVTQEQVNTRMAEIVAGQGDSPDIEAAQAQVKKEFGL